MTTELGRLLSPRETADYLGIHKNTLDNWHATDYGPPRYKLRGRVVYRVAEVDSWVSQQIQNRREEG
jgi:predicted DNA-binding transcriptional regulator AlpA